MAGRFARSLELARASWSVVKADKELLWFPVMTAVALFLIVGSFVVPTVALGGYASGAAPEPGAGMSLAGFAFYIIAYFIGLFFNTALVGAAMIRLDGGDPTVRDGLRIAWSRVGRIFGYACIAGTVGLLLRAVEERIGWAGRIVVGLIGMAWTLATFLVVPILVTRDSGPVEAVKESATLLKETWGENIIGSVGLGLVFGLGYFALAAVSVIAIFVTLGAQSPTLTVTVVLLGVASFLLLATLHSTMQGVYSAALYRHATHAATPPQGFTPELLQQAFRPRG